LSLDARGGCLYNGNTMVSFSRTGFPSRFDAIIS